MKNENSKKQFSCLNCCCLPFLCACCVLQTILCAVLIVTLILLGNYIINSSNVHHNNFKNPSNSKYVRLSSDTVPVHYNLTLFPNLTSGNFHGSVEITLRLKSAKQFVVLNNQNLSIEYAEVRNQSLLIKNIPRADNVGSEISTLNFTRKLEGGNYVLTLNFSGNMRDKLKGFYLSKYKNKSNETRTIATTKFEPTYARQAFPCFDEPNMKAKYTVHLWKPNATDYIALSNYPQVSEEDYEGGKLVHFAETVSMSTYLSCFIVSDFKYTETHFLNDGKKVNFRVYATPEQLNKTSYAGKVGKAAIEFYIDYFNIPYPLPKLDMVAIPDYSSGATEHWGLVTFRETALLFNPNEHSTENQQRVLLVVAHELAHSWFGNLVTMDWWDNLWLNEGFASYIEYKGGNAAEPDFGLMEQFLVRELHPVLSLDAKLSSHPIIKEVLTPDQITEVFDMISYNKGAAVLRMLEGAVGEEIFKTGVTNYLNKYAYSNAVTRQLWDEIQQILDDKSVDVYDFMDTFTMQMGYPILTVEIATTDNATLFKVTQKRFLENPSDASNQQNSKFNFKWTLPIKFLTNGGESNQTTWFKRSENEVSISVPEGTEWVKLNPRQVGYYRVNYPEFYWKILSEHMLEFPISDRTHLLEEAFSIANSGQLSFEVPLNLTKYLISETNFTPWSVASTQFNSLSRILDGSEFMGKFKEYVIRILSPIYDEVSWNVSVSTDSHMKKLLRVVVLKLACEMGHGNALENASKLLEIWFKTRSAEPDLRDIIYKYGLRSSSVENWEKMFEIFKTEKDANEKLKQLQGLTSTLDQKVLIKLLQVSSDENYIRKQDYYQFVAFMARNPVGLPLIWDYYRENWESLVRRFTLNDRSFGGLITHISWGFSTKTKLAEMQNFFEMYPEAGAGTAARKRALENVKNRIYKIEKYQNIIGKWFVKNVQN